MTQTYLKTRAFVKNKMRTIALDSGAWLAVASQLQMERVMRSRTSPFRLAASSGLALVLVLGACGRTQTNAAAAEPELPKITKGTPYAEARKQLTAKGFTPLYILARRIPGEAIRGEEWCPADGDKTVCEQFPELMRCSNGAFEGCGWLYRHPASQRLAVVTTRCEKLGVSYCYSDIAWAKASDLEDIMFTTPEMAKP